MRKPLVLLFAFALLLSARSAYAQSAGLTGGGSGGGGAPRFYGLSFQYSMWDSSSINTVAYYNGFGQLFEPTWSFGKLFFRGTRFQGAHIAGRLLLNRQLYGYDPNGVTTYSDNGYAVRCSNITPAAQGGVVDPNQVQRCQYDQSNRWAFGDPWLTIRVPRIVTIPYAKINVNPSFRFIIPLSPESRFATTNLVISPGLGFSRVFLDGKISVGYTFLANKFFHRYNTPGQSVDGAPLRDTLVSQGYGLDDIRPSTENFLSDPTRVGVIGGYNPDYSLLQIFSVGLVPHEKLAFSFLYILSDSFAYRAPCMTTVNGQPHDLCAAGQQVAENSGSSISYVGRNNMQILWVSANFEANDWLSFSLSWINGAPQRHPDGSLRQPFFSFDYNAFTSVNLGASVSLDTVAAKFF